jgi:hypothetical protein
LITFPLPCQGKIRENFSKDKDSCESGVDFKISLHSKKQQKPAISSVFERILFVCNINNLWQGDSQLKKLNVEY